MQQHQSVTLQPIKSDGTLAPQGSDSAFVTARGVYTLSAGTWYVEIPTRDMNPVNVQLQGDASVVITSATLEETMLPEKEAPLYGNATGTWHAVDITRITSEVEGTGWTNTNDVGAASGGNAGSVQWNEVDGGARRKRLAIVVGTEGEVRITA